MVLLKVYDPMERDIPRTKIIAGNLEKQVVVDGGKKAVKENFEKGFDKDFEKFQGQMKKRRIPLILIDTLTAVDMQLKEILKGVKR